MLLPSDWLRARPLEAEPDQVTRWFSLLVLLGDTELSQYQVWTDVTVFGFVVPPQRQRLLRSADLRPREEPARFLDADGGSVRASRLKSFRCLSPEDKEAERFLFCEAH